MTSYRRLSSGGDESAKLLVYGLLAILFIGFNVWFYSADADGQGTVVDKWTYTTTSCDSDGDCTTTVHYMIQLSDGRIYGVFWGRLHWDGIMTGQYIQFEARGRFISLWGWRIAVPDIFKYEVLEGGHP